MKASNTQIDAFIKEKTTGDLHGLQKKVCTAFKRFGPDTAYNTYEKMRDYGIIPETKRFSSIQGRISELKNDLELLEVVEERIDNTTGHRVEVYDIAGRNPLIWYRCQHCPNGQQLYRGVHTWTCNECGTTNQEGEHR